MTTFADMHNLNSVKDFSLDLVAELIEEYKIRGKNVDPRQEKFSRLFNRVDWIINRIGRVLDVSGKMDPEKTTFRINRGDNRLVHVRFIDLEGNTLYTLHFGKMLDGKTLSPGFFLEDAEGNEVLQAQKWVEVRRFFAPVEEVVAEAANPIVA